MKQALIKKFLNHKAPIRELSLKFYSPSKYFREIFTNNREAYEPLGGVSSDDANTATRQLVYSSNTVSIRESDELLITCTVNSSKPAAVLSLWVMQRPSKRRRSSSSSRFGHGPGDEFDLDSDARRLDIIDSYVTKNAGDMTLKTVSTSKFVVSRNDNHRLVTCVAENPSLNEKWETKRILNVLCTLIVKKYF